MAVFIKSDNEIVIGDKSMLSKQELMDKLCVSRSTLQRWQRMGLPFADFANNLNGYCLETVIQWLKSQGQSDPLIAAEIRGRKRKIKKD